MLHTRRSVLAAGGAMLAGGVAAAGAAESGRYLVDTRGLRGGRLERSDLNVVHDLDAVGVAVVSGPEQAVDALGVPYAPDATYDLRLPVDRVPASAAETGSDEPYYPNQWDKQAQNVEAAHETTRGAGVRVAIIDSGIGADHPDLRGAVNRRLSRDFTGDGYGTPGPWGGFHGTHVAGVVAARQNDAGILGSAPDAELVDCRVFSGEGGATFGDVLAAIIYSAAIRADIANLSLGAYPVPRPGLGAFYGRLLNRATTYASSRGTLLVAAAGNDAADLQHDGAAVSLPTEAANVVSVSATGPVGFGWGDEGLREPPTTPAFYTNYGTNAIDVSAPGGNADPDAVGSDVPWYRDLVLSTVAEASDGGVTYGYAYAGGTSMAAPQVSGAAALVKSVTPGATASQVRQRLLETARDVGDRAYHGHGFVAPAAAVRR